MAGEEKQCRAVVKAARSWGQPSASPWLEHSLGPGWVLRGGRSSTGQAAAQGSSCLAGGKCFTWWQVFPVLAAPRAVQGGSWEPVLPSWAG